MAMVSAGLVRAALPVTVHCLRLSGKGCLRLPGEGVRPRVVWSLGCRLFVAVVA